MYLKQSTVLYPPLCTRCDGRTFVRLTEDWPPEIGLAFPVPAGVAPIQQLSLLMPGKASRREWIDTRSCLLTNGKAELLFQAQT